MMRGYYYPTVMGGGGWWGILIALFWLLVIAGIVVLIVWAVRQMSRGAHGHNVPGTGYYTEPGQPKDEACEVARMRYARGEITREQFDEICRGLGVPTAPPSTSAPPPGPAAPPAPPAPPPAGQ
jgi:putative membrane protein